MITEILKERAPDQKPRFFLHDEMIAWLKDNMKIQVNQYATTLGDSQLAEKLGIPHSMGLTDAIHIDMTITVGGSVIATQSTKTSIYEYHKAFRTLANVTETCMVHITNLQNEVTYLKAQLNSYENRPVS